jgi:hypothetical protein
MKVQPDQSTQQVLAGIVERVTYHNVENGFCVLGIKARGHRDLVAVVGHAAVISAGEWITATGEWVNDRTPWPAVQGAVPAHIGAKFDRGHREISRPASSSSMFWIYRDLTNIIL